MIFQINNNNDWIKSQWSEHNSGNTATPVNIFPISFDKLSFYCSLISVFSNTE